MKKSILKIKDLSKTKPLNKQQQNTVKGGTKESIIIIDIIDG